jgi:hypothetical protein
MGHLLSSAIKMSASSGTPTGSMTATLNKIPSNTTGTLTVLKNGASYLTRSTNGTSTGTITTGDTFSASQSGGTLLYRSLVVGSSRRGQLFFGEREPGTPGVISSGTFTKEDDENITIEGLVTSA